jgi:hypothetical protein
MDSAILRIGNHFPQIDFASRWDELQPEQFRAIAYAKCTSTDVKQTIFHMLMNLLRFERKHLWYMVELAMQEGRWLQAVNLFFMWCFFKSEYVWKLIATDDVMDALPSLEWVFEKETDQRTSLVKEFTLGKQRYEGPRILLGGLVWKQMQLADAICDRFVKTKDENLLTHLAAVLYIDADSRFNHRNNSVNKRIEKFEKLPNDLKYAIYVNYVHLRESFYKQFELPESELETKGRPDWDNVTLSVAEGGSLGPFDKVELTPANIVMKFFEKSHKDAKRLKN